MNDEERMDLMFSPLDFIDIDVPECPRCKTSALTDKLELHQECHDPHGHSTIECGTCLFCGAVWSGYHLESNEDARPVCQGCDSRTSVYYDEGAACEACDAYLEEFDNGGADS